MSDQQTSGRWGLGGTIVGTLVFVGILVVPTPAGLAPDAQRVLAVSALMAIFWMTGALPLAITALLPLALYPLLGIMGSDQAARLYANDLIFLFFSGFFLALTLQRWNLHRRLALAVMVRFGTRPASLILGVMVAVASLSMWISNTAATLMMLPICLAMIEQVGEDAEDREAVRSFGVALLLGTAYGANIGGMGTPLGTPPNGILIRQFQGPYAPAFAEWLLFGLPLVAVFLTLVWFLLTHVLFRFDRSLRFGDRDFIRRRLESQGTLAREEKAVLVVFALVVLSWIFRRDVDVGGVHIPGWVSGLNALIRQRITDSASSGVGDSVAGILGVILLCAVRVRRGGEPLARWEQMRELPWDVLLLLGGGMALAAGFSVSHGDGQPLASWIGAQLGHLENLPPVLLIFVVCLSITFLTEVTSNTATASVMIPILATIGSGTQSFLLCLAAALSCSCAFMLPVATPPNAIVFGSHHLELREMLRAGVVINIAGAVLITAFIATLGAAIFGR